MNNLYQRDCLRLLDFNSKELKNIIILAEKLKNNKKNDQEIKLLNKKNIALIFNQKNQFWVAPISENGSYNLI